MIRFAEYFDFEKSYQDRYYSLAEHYPLVLAVLEKELRNFMAGRKWLAERNVSRRAQIGASRYLLEKSAPVFFNRASNLKNAKVLFSLPRFIQSEGALISAIESRGLDYVVAYRRMGHAYQDFMTGRYAVRPNVGAISPTTRLVFRHLKKRGVNDFLSDHFLLFQLQNKLNLEIESLCCFLKKQKIKLIICEGDSEPNDRMLLEAAARCEISYVVVAHGYIQDPKLITIAPVRANGLLVWTEDQLSALRNSLPPDQAKRVLFYGYPKDVADKTRREPHRVLIALEPLITLRESNSGLHPLKRLFSSLRFWHEPFSVRLHPKDRRRNEFPRILNELQLSLSEVSHLPLVEDFSRAKVLLATNSSVLIEAAYAGVPAIQMADYAKFYFEGVTVLPIKSLDIHNVNPLVDIPRSELLASRVHEILDQFLS